MSQGKRRWRAISKAGIRCLSSETGEAYWFFKAFQRDQGRFVRLGIGRALSVPNGQFKAVRSQLDTRCSLRP